MGGETLALAPLSSAVVPLAPATSFAGVPDRRPSGRYRFLGLIALAIAPALFFLAAEAYLFDGDWQFPLDDSWIHLVFARSLAHGEGLAFNPGEPVAGTTAPLWTALLGLLALLPGSIFLWAKGAGIAAHATSVALVELVARRLGLSVRRATVAAALVACSDWLVWSSLSGMEVNLFVALLLGGVARHLRERAASRDGTESLPPLSFLLFALAALARPEGLLLPLLAALDRALHWAPPAPDAPGVRLLPLARRDVLEICGGLVLALLVLVPVGWAFYEMSGSFLPTTVAAKSSGPPVWIPDRRLLSAIAGLLVVSQPWMTLLALGGVAESVRRLGEPQDRGLLLATWTLGLPFASSMLSSGKEVALGNFGRYFFPLLPCVVLLGMLALQPLSFARWRSLTLGKRLDLPAGALLLVVIFSPALFSLSGGFRRYLNSCTNVRESNVALARWLQPRVPPEALLAVNDAGVFKYLLRNPVLDLVGLMSPEVTRRRTAAAAQGIGYGAVLRDVIEERQPDYLIIFPSWFSFPGRHPESFHPLRILNIRDNIAMGSEMIVLYDTPWTRWPLAAVAEDAALPASTESR